MAEITTADVQRAYECGLACLDSLEPFRAAALELKQFAKEHEDEPLAADLVEAFEEALEALREPVAMARRALGPVEELLDACSNGRVDVQCHQAPSYLAAHVAYMEEKVEHGGQALEAERRHAEANFHNLGNMGNWQPERARAELKVERARVKERVRRAGGRELMAEDGLWRLENGLVHFEGPLAQLKGQSRILLRFLIDRGRSGATYQDLADHVWGAEWKSNGTIQQGVSSLKKTLRELDAADVAERIANTGDGYRLFSG